MSDAVRLVFGVPTYKWSANFADALDSLVAQRDPRVALVIRQDGNDPEAHEYLSRLAKDYPNIDYAANETRLGMIANWRLVFAEAQRLHPEAPYFAWASDHDVWHPDFASQMIRELDENPDAVLAYPRRVQISDDADPLGVPFTFETRGESDPAKRLRAAWDGMSAGAMVYGVYKADALEAAGVFPKTLLPDQILLLRLAPAGTFVQVDNVLWWRRKASEFSIRRQRKSLFGPHAPLYVRVPSVIQRPFAVGAHLNKRGQQLGLSRLTAFRWFLRMVFQGLWRSARKLARRFVNFATDWTKRVVLSNTVRPLAKAVFYRMTGTPRKAERGKQKRATVSS